MAFLELGPGRALSKMVAAAYAAFAGANGRVVPHQEFVREVASAQKGDLFRFSCFQELCNFQYFAS
jgi:hypothetical protein